MRLIILLQSFLALAILALAAPQSIQKRELKGKFYQSGFSRPQIAQIKAGMVDVWEMASVVSRAALQEPEESKEKSEARHILLMNVFNKYFEDYHFSKVLQVCWNIDNNPDSISEEIEMLSTFREYDNGPDICEDKRTQALMVNFIGESQDETPRMLVCDNGIFDHSTTQKYHPGRTPGKKGTLTCADFPRGTKVNASMRPLGHFFLRALMHWKSLVQPPLTERVMNYMNGPYAVTETLKSKFPGKSIENDDSFAWFVTEAFWTLKCGWEFESAEPSDIDEIGENGILLGE